MAEGAAEAGGTARRACVTALTQDGDGHGVDALVLDLDERAGLGVGGAAEERCGDDERQRRAGRRSWCELGTQHRCALRRAGYSGGRASRITRVHRKRTYANLRRLWVPDRCLSASCGGARLQQRPSVHTHAACTRMLRGSCSRPGPVPVRLPGCCNHCYVNENSMVSPVRSELFSCRDASRRPRTGWCIACL